MYSYYSSIILLSPGMSSLSSLYLCKWSLQISCSFSASSFETHTFKVLFKFLLSCLWGERGEDTHIFTTNSDSQQVGTVGKIFRFLVLARNWVIWSSLASHYWQGRQPFLISPSSSHFHCQGYWYIMYQSSIMKTFYLIISVLTQSVLQVLPGTGWYNNLPRARDFFYLRAVQDGRSKFLALRSVLGW